MAEVAPYRNRRRGKYPGTRVALHLALKDRGDIERRHVQAERVTVELDPFDLRVVSGQYPR